MQFVRFIAVGAMNSLVGIACIFVAMRWIGLDYRIANCLGYLVGFVVSFLLNRSLTFGDKGPLFKTAARWIFLVTFCFVLNLAVAIYLREWWRADVLIAQVSGIVVYTLTSFVGARLLVFRHTSGDDAPQHG